QAFLPVSGRVLMGSRDGRLPSRGCRHRGRPIAQRLGHPPSPARCDRARPQPRRRVRPLSPLRAARWCDAGSGPARAPALDVVAAFMTIKEFVCFLDRSYKMSDEPFAPGKVTSQKVLNRARHHAIYGHGLAVRAIRAACGAKCPPVGLAENIPNIVPLLDSEH